MRNYVDTAFPMSLHQQGGILIVWQCMTVWCPLMQHQWLYMFHVVVHFQTIPVWPTWMKSQLMYRPHAVVSCEIIPIWPLL